MIKKIYLAGGCFWGVEAYFLRINGVLETTVGYAQGHVENPSYEEVCQQETGHTEACEVTYDDTVVNLNVLLSHLFRVIDPTSLNKQGGDVGPQYRTGVYYLDESDRSTINQFIAFNHSKYEAPIVVEVEKLDSYYLAEDYHQDYLIKNPTGYCHINLAAFRDDIK